MSSGKSRKRQFGELLHVPFRHKRSRSSSPTPSLAPSSTPVTNTSNNVLSQPRIRASGSAGSGGPPHATGHQSQALQPPIHYHPVENEAFQMAIQKYLANLSEDDKVAFRSATDVREKLRESHISSSTRMQRVEKVLQCVNRFLASTAICIQQHPEISSIVVGGLHCILVVSTSCLLI